MLRLDLLLLELLEAAFAQVDAVFVRAPHWTEVGAALGAEEREVVHDLRL